MVYAEGLYQIIPHQRGLGKLKETLNSRLVKYIPIKILI